MHHLVTAAINRYKSRKHWTNFSAWLTNSELELTVDWLYFLSRKNIRVVYDIGAAVGHFSAACAKIKNISSVVAFEPGLEELAHLKTLQRRFNKLIVVPLALGSNAGNHDFYVTADGRSSSCLQPNQTLTMRYPRQKFQQKITVKVETLDRAITEKQLPLPDLIKLDTQGYELEVLRGGSQAMRNVSFCIVECCYEPLYVEAPLIGDVFKFFMDLGWQNVGTSPSSRSSSGRPVYADLVFASHRGLACL